jgi:uncharacterized membrane protein YkgB
MENCGHSAAIPRPEYFTLSRPNRLLETASRLDRLGITPTRVGLVVVPVWIGGLKMYRYEDEGIVPFVANSPVMSIF